MANYKNLVIENEVNRLKKLIKIKNSELEENQAAVDILEVEIEELTEKLKELTNG